MGAIPEGASSAEKKGGSSQEALTQFLLEEIKKKEKELDSKVKKDQMNDDTKQ